MKKWQCCIIEDEPLAMERIKSYVEKIPSLELSASFFDALHGLAHLQENSIDILFLDVNLDELSGIELLESSNLSCEVILTTAYEQYALQGYELNITDYLLKPFTFQRFLQAANKAQINLQKTTTVAADQKFLFVKTENRLEKIMLSEILYIEGMGDYRSIQTIHKRVLTLQTFGQLEAMISSDTVVRVHKSFMVSLAHIQTIERGRIVVSDKRIPISLSFRERFYERIQ